VAETLAKSVITCNDILKSKAEGQKDEDGRMKKGKRKWGLGFSVEVSDVGLCNRLLGSCNRLQRDWLLHFLVDKVAI
jgi:hypothetical protein